MPVERHFEGAAGAQARVARVESDRDRGGIVLGEGGVGFVLRVGCFELAGFGGVAEQIDQPAVERVAHGVEGVECGGPVALSQCARQAGEGGHQRGRGAEYGVGEGLGMLGGDTRVDRCMGLVLEGRAQRDHGIEQAIPCGEALGVQHAALSGGPARLDTPQRCSASLGLEVGDVGGCLRLLRCLLGEGQLDLGSVPFGFDRALGGANESGCDLDPSNQSMRLRAHEVNGRRAVAHAGGPAAGGERGVHDQAQQARVAAGWPDGFIVGADGIVAATVIAPANDEGLGLAADERHRRLGRHDPQVTAHEAVGRRVPSRRKEFGALSRRGVLGGRLESGQLGRL